MDIMKDEQYLLLYYLYLDDNLHLFFLKIDCNNLFFKLLLIFLKIIPLFINGNDFLFCIFNIFLLIETILDS